jgi:RNA polymerase sigma-70 factor (ECF subfamily)
MNYSTTWHNQVADSSDIKKRKTEKTPLAEKTDQELIDLVLTGEKIAFEQIFERYKRLVASVAVYYFKRPEQVDEIIQIAFAKVYFELNKFNGDHKYALAGWLKRITANVCLDTLRKQKRTPENLSCEISEEGIESLFGTNGNDIKSAEDLLSDRDLAEKLLSHIPAEDEAILRMYYADGMKTREISEVTGWSNSKIKTRACRAKKHLRRILKKYL